MADLESLQRLNITTHCVKPVGIDHTQGERSVTMAGSNSVSEKPVTSKWTSGLRVIRENRKDSYSPAPFS
jgi:hypothetical protein